MTTKKQIQQVVGAGFKHGTFRYIGDSNALTTQLSLEYSLTILYLLEQKWMETLWVMSEIC